jgi:antirestriction protein ArdC
MITKIAQPFHEAVAEKLIRLLREGTAPWQKGWQAGEPGALLPMNPMTGKRYQGINAIQLMSQGHADPRWLTYKQAAAMGAQVSKGERGTPIQYWKFSEAHDKTDTLGNPVRDAEGRRVKEDQTLERPRVFMAIVFNAAQIDGLAPMPPQQAAEWPCLDRAEQLLRSSGATLVHAAQNRAFYQPVTDRIHLPHRTQFATAAAYYATALHELGHWTGHPSRLNRDLSHPFGSAGYAREELRAEIASMILGSELGLGHDPAQHASYVASWIQVLRKDPLEIFRAAADAEKIQRFVLGLEQAQELRQSQGASALPVDASPPQVTEAPMQTSLNKGSGRAAPAELARNRTFLAVPFNEHEDAKALGARWDRRQHSWYVPVHLDPNGCRTFPERPLTCRKRRTRQPGLRWTRRHRLNAFTLPCPLRSAHWPGWRVRHGIRLRSPGTPALVPICKRLTDGAQKTAPMSRDRPCTRGKSLRQPCRPMVCWSPENTRSWMVINTVSRSKAASAARWTVSMLVIWTGIPPGASSITRPARM